MLLAVPPASPPATALTFRSPVDAVDHVVVVVGP